VVQTSTTSTRSTTPRTPVSGRPRERSTKSSVLIIKLLSLGLVVGLAVALTPTLIGDHRWLFLAVVWIITALALASYGTRRALPAKYLLPGTLMLFLFVVYPVLMTAQASTTNFGDGTRSTKQETINTILATSVTQTPDSPRFNLTVATTGSLTTGPFTFDQARLRRRHGDQRVRHRGAG
jgi:arabinogalactan oligomer / maltooligosaccharide transport system permease protein